LPGDIKPIPRPRRPSSAPPVAVRGAVLYDDSVESAVRAAASEETGLVAIDASGDVPAAERSSSALGTHAGQRHRAGWGTFFAALAAAAAIVAGAALYVKDRKERERAQHEAQVEAHLEQLREEARAQAAASPAATATPPGADLPGSAAGRPSELDGSAQGDARSAPTGSPAPDGEAEAARHEAATAAREAAAREAAARER